MSDEQVKVVGTVEDVARAAYAQGFCEGYDAARLVVEVLANEERRGGRRPKSQASRRVRRKKRGRLYRLQAGCRVQPQKKAVSQLRPTLGSVNTGGGGPAHADRQGGVFLGNSLTCLQLSKLV